MREMIMQYPFFAPTFVMDFSAFEADTDLPGAEDGRAVSALFFVPVRISYCLKRNRKTKAFVPIYGLIFEMHCSIVAKNGILSMWFVTQGHGTGSAIFGGRHYE